MTLTMTLVLTSAILVGIYLVSKNNKNSLICLLSACLFLLLALLNTNQHLTESSSNAYNINVDGEIKLF